MRPDALVRTLKPIALDLRWAWSNSANRLWEQLDSELWHSTYSPWVVLQSVGRDRLEILGESESFLADLEICRNEQKHATTGATWFSRHPDTKQLTTIAYFSMEFGLNEALPIYSGGLGVLAGDHLKSASDLGVPVVGIGLLYSDGYFRQILDPDGSQRELYPRNDSEQLPIEPLRDDTGARLRVTLNFPGRDVHVRAWEARVGRTRLLLLDCNDPANHPADRAITNRLYGGGPEERLRQEFVLGIGGRRLLKALHIQPDLNHLNEGHAAFAVLEYVREIMEKEHCDFSVALRAARAGTVFTTHTAVEAAFDRFSPALIRHYFTEYANQLGIGIDAVLRLGTLTNSDSEPFTMAYLAMRGVTSINAVSRLHGDVSQELFAPLFPRYPFEDVPVTYVTNGVHTPSWASPEAEALIGKQHISDAQLWEMRNAGRHRLVEAARERLVRRLCTYGSETERVAEAQHALDPHIFTIGFARRFATYKRPTLLLSQPDRLAAMILNSERPVQIVVAGKAHPQDEPGKELVRAWVSFANRPDLRHRVVFIDDYDLFVAEELVQGSDLWLNNPRRPWEASGTSGMKVLVNGGINLSELDGWWAEAANPEVGWSLGDGEMHENDPGWDAREAETLYQLLENEIIPRFYHRGADGIPHDWITKVRGSMEGLVEQFSSDRMVREYTEKIYLPAAAAQRERIADGARKAAEIEAAVKHIVGHWHEIQFGALHEEQHAGHRVAVLEVALGSIPPEHLRVELYTDFPRCVVALKHEGGRYTGQINDARPLSSFTARALPAVPGTKVPLEVPLIAWQR